MAGLPQRNPRYHEGPTVTRSVRVNEELWKDFSAHAGRQGYSIADALKQLMEQALQPAAVPEGGEPAPSPAPGAGDAPTD